MWSSGSSSSLQRIYDESYLKCSTAVYYESLGDEKEATLCWKTALDRIRIGTANNKKHVDHAPKSETERTLVQSLRELEVQCKERIDLLEALRLSRKDLDAPDNATGHETNSHGVDGAGPADSLPRSGSGTPRKGWIGDGTVPAFTYPELSRPALPPRPSLAHRSSSEQAVAASPTPTSIDQILDQFKASTSGRPPSLPPYGPLPPAKDAPRPPSPDKRTMRTTLRSSKPDRSSPRTSRAAPSRASKGPGASEAATLAWSALGQRTSLDSTVDPRRPSPRPVEPRHSNDQPRHSSSSQGYWDSHTRRLVPSQPNTPNADPPSDTEPAPRSSSDYTANAPSPLALGAASSALNTLSLQDRIIPNSASKRRPTPKKTAGSGCPPGNHYRSSTGPSTTGLRVDLQTPERLSTRDRRTASSSSRRLSQQRSSYEQERELTSSSEDTETSLRQSTLKGKEKLSAIDGNSSALSLDISKEENEDSEAKSQWERKKRKILKSLPPGVDGSAAKAIFNEIVVQGDTVHWSDVAGLEIAKNALREAVVYPFLRPDLFMGLREPASGMLLFGPPGTGKTMLARAVATESKSTFFSISASSLTSKYLGESEKLVRALFALAKVMAPSIIFIDEIDSLLSQRSGSGDHESTRRIKTEFLIQWSDLQRAAAGRESPKGTGDRGDANRVLVLAATNLPWAIDEAARRRFVRRQYIPLPEPETRAIQLKTLLGQQKHNLTEADISQLVDLTDGFSGSDITALAKDAAMGPLRSLGDALLHMAMDEIRPIELGDFQASLRMIRPSVDRDGLKQYEDWARQFGERGG